MLLAAGAQSAVRCPRGRAEFRRIEGSIGICLQQLFQTPHYRCVAAPGAAGLSGHAATDARNHRVHEGLLQRPSDLGLYQDVGGSFGEVAGRFMQTSTAAIRGVEEVGYEA